MRCSILFRVGLAAGVASLATCDGAPEPGPAPPGTAAVASGEAGGGGAAGAGGAGGETPAAAHLVGPQVITLPYVVAGAGGSAIAVEIENDGDRAAEPLQWQLTGSARLALTEAPASIEAGGKAALAITFEGAPSETIEAATLSVTTTAGAALSVPVFAVAGDPGLGSGTWEPVEGGGGVACGEGVTVSMPAAPFPHAGAPYTDDRVRVFVPEGHRDLGSGSGAAKGGPGAEDLVVHFHGHSTTLAETLSKHRFEAHVCASGADAVLVVPQGPYEAASSDFGKLMDPGGLEALLREVLVLLYRDGRTRRPVVGDLVLTSHSGGYAAVAENLDPTVNAAPVAQVDLFDSMYGDESAFTAYVAGGGVLRSNYTAGSGTAGHNQLASAMIEAAGVAVATEPTQSALRDGRAVLYAADTTHAGATRLDGAYGEQLRWGLRHHRHGPRVELVSAIASGDLALVRWRAPRDEDTLGFAVQTSTGGVWSTVAAAGPSATEATFPAGAGARVRVVPIVDGLPDDEVVASDVYRVDPAPEVLVVDAFNRVLDGSYGGSSHAFAAVVGEALGHVATVSEAAVAEDGLDLSSWPAVVWLAGDDSTADRPIAPGEREALSAYVAGGGALVVSGSEVAYDLVGTAEGGAMLLDVFGADLAADDSGSHSVSGAGALAPLGDFTYAGPGAPYEEDYPDALEPIGQGEVVLAYGTGTAAAVGVPGAAVLVGFPLELVDDDADRAAVAGALLGFAAGN